MWELWNVLREEYSIFVTKLPLNLYKPCVPHSTLQPPPGAIPTSCSSQSASFRYKNNASACPLLSSSSALSFSSQPRRLSTEHPSIWPFEKGDTYTGLSVHVGHMDDWQWMAGLHRKWLLFLFAFTCVWGRDNVPRLSTDEYTDDNKSGKTMDECGRVGPLNQTNRRKGRIEQDSIGYEGQWYWFDFKSPQ